ncbi:MAG: hypothetical protein KAU28_04425, partial [Phycisphaerae bacterium]|nr:hypothetical protein [Phycisphaerae bacterium]
MATFADLRRRRRQSRAKGSYDLGPALPPDEGPGLGARIWQPFGELFEWMGEVDEASRRLAGRVVGAPGATAEEPFTGEALLEQALGFESPEGTPGEIELRDVPGFLTEVAVSPFNLLSLGLLTKGGRLAARGTRLLERARALRASTVPGQAVAARELLPQIRGITRLARRRGVPATLAPSWRQQAEVGQR